MHNTVLQTGLVGNGDVHVLMYGPVVHVILHVGVTHGREGHAHCLLVSRKIGFLRIKEKLVTILGVIQQQYGRHCRGN